MYTKKCGYNFSDFGVLKVPLYCFQFSVFVRLVRYDVCCIITVYNHIEARLK